MKTFGEKYSESDLLHFICHSSIYIVLVNVLPLFLSAYNTLQVTFTKGTMPLLNPMIQVT